MRIDWAVLGMVFGVGLAATLGIVVLFSGGIRALSARAAIRQSGSSGALGLTVALLCFLACTVIVLYGVYVIVAA